jgi:hypothetical protein
MFEGADSWRSVKPCEAGGTPMYGLRFFFDFFLCRCGGIVPSKAICIMSKPVFDKHTRIIYEVYPLQATPYSPPLLLYSVTLCTHPCLCVGIYPIYRLKTCAVLVCIFCYCIVCYPPFII